MPDKTKLAKIALVAIMILLIISFFTFSGFRLLISSGFNKVAYWIDALDSGKDLYPIEKKEPPPSGPEAKLAKETGLFQKVVATTETDFLSKPGGSASSKRTEFFRTYFVLDSQREAESILYKLSRTPFARDFQGWLSGSFCHRWDHRVGYRKIREGERWPRTNIFASDVELDDALCKGKRGIQRLYEVFHNYEFVLTPWPCLNSKRLSDQREGVELLFAAVYAMPNGTSEPADHIPVPEKRPGISESEIAEIQSGIKILEVVFVVDTTWSMDPYIIEIKKIVEYISKNLQSCDLRPRSIEIPKEFKDFDFHPNLRFGLVEYRDHHEDFGYVYKPYDLVSTEQEFSQEVVNLQAASEDMGKGESCAEAAFEGVNAAIDHISWNSNRMSNRVIVLIGDNSSHENQISQDVLIAKCNRFNANVFSMLLPEVKCELSDGSRHRRQWKELAEGTGGELLELNSYINFASTIEHAVRDKVARMMEDYIISEIEFHQPTHSPLRETVDQSRMVEFVRRVQGRGFNVSSQPINDSGITVNTGWAVTEVAGQTALDREIMMTREEVRFLIRELNLTASVLEKDLSTETGHQGLAKIYSDLWQIHAGEHGYPSFFLYERPENQALFFKSLGIPVKDDTILRKTRRELEEMPTEQKQDMSRQLDQCAIMLQKQLADDRRFPKGSEIGWVADEALP